MDILNPVNLRQKDFQGDQNIHKSSDISSGDLNPSLNPSGRTGNTVSQVAGLKSSTTKKLVVQNILLLPVICGKRTTKGAKIVHLSNLSLNR